MANQQGLEISVIKNIILIVIGILFLRFFVFSDRYYNKMYTYCMKDMESSEYHKEICGCVANKTSKEYRKQNITYKALDLVCKNEADKIGIRSAETMQQIYSAATQILKIYNKSFTDCSDKYEAKIERAMKRKYGY